MINESTAPISVPHYRLQRTLARAQSLCPALRPYQIDVGVADMEPSLFLLPAIGKRAGRITLTFSRQGGLLVSSRPRGISETANGGLNQLIFDLSSALATRPEEPKTRAEV